MTMGWRDVPVREPLEERLGVPVTVGHDVRTGAVAEATFGAAAGAGSSLFVPIGTGLCCRRDPWGHPSGCHVPGR